MLSSLLSEAILNHQFHSWSQMSEVYRSTNTVNDSKFSFGWFEQTLHETLERWLEKSVTDSGLFMTHFDRYWQPKDKTFGTLVSQSRLLYNFAQGFLLTGEAGYREAIERGAAFLLKNFRDRQHGGWFLSCERNGTVIDKTKDTYGHAFVIFGLAHAFHATQNHDYLQAAIMTWEILCSKLRDRRGGFVVRTSADFSFHDASRNQNPLMHLFEALLGLGDQKGMAEMYGEAAKVSEFVLTKLVRASDDLLPELFDQDWQPLPKQHGGYVDLGHAFEWSFLLSSGVERGLPEHYLQHASAFLQNGVRLGIDREHGGVLSRADTDGTVLGHHKGWWQQCEAIRALLHHAWLRDQEQLVPLLCELIAFCDAHFVDHEHGGWFMGEFPHVDGFIFEKGQTGKVGYHVVGMCVEALRLRGAAD